MITPILTGEEIKVIRLRLGLTQEQLATRLGFTGHGRRQRVSKLETDFDTIDYTRANLLLAMDDGYEPTGYEPDGITLRQAEALWVAREEGRATNLITTERGAGGGFKRMLKVMVGAGMLGPRFAITEFGATILKGYEAHHKLRPRTKSHPDGRWA